MQADPKADLAAEPEAELETDPNGDPAGASRTGEFAAWLSVVKTYALCERSLARALAPLGLTVPKNDVLMNIARRPGLTQQQLADRLLVARSNVSMLLRDLEQAGLVSRQASRSDGRVKKLFLTTAGEALVESSRPLQQQVISHMLGVCSTPEIEQLSRVMERVAQSLKEWLEQHPPA